MEQVFVVRRRDFFGGLWPQGFDPLDRSMATELMARFTALGFFVDRGAAEEQPEWKQLIPYCVLRQAGSVFCVQRKATQTEARLHGRLSIGIGGHVNPAPHGAAGGEAFFRAALQRELAEELHGTGGPDFEPAFLGLLNDDSNAVGRVHVGLVYAIDCPSRAGGGATPRVRETSKMVGGFRPLVELRPLWQDPDRFESWSRILIEAGIAGAEAVSRAGRFPSARPHNGREESIHG